MLWFIIGIIFALFGLAVVAFGGNVKVPESYPEKRMSIRKTAWVPLVLAAILIGVSMVTVVGTKNTGVKTVFNKPTGETIGAGLEIKAPWVAVTDIDSTIHPEEYTGDDAIKVKIADGGDADVWLSYRWRINPENADQVFQDYRNSELDIDDAVRKAIVSTNIKASINEVLGGYDPLSGVAKLGPNATPEELSNVEINVVPDYPQLNKDIQANVAGKIKENGDLVEIQSVTVSRIVLPEGTQKRINAYNQAVQDTKIAIQQIATKSAQADANDELAKSLQDPNVLVSQCFDALVAGDFTPPAGFSCWPGGGGGVVLPAVPAQK
jgi:regulator of protease activity HflC (stomatin/prohibitin superfamily)